jgi:hypothetical protein
MQLILWVAESLGHSRSCLNPLWAGFLSLIMRNRFSERT